MIDRRCLQMLLLVTSAGAAKCSDNDVGEVSSPHNLTCDIAKMTGSAKWLKEDSLISECTEAFTECATQKEFIGSYKASFVDRTATLIIGNVTLQNEGRYSCIDVASNNLSTIYLNVYARPENVSCHVPELQTDMLNVKVVCTVTRTYPSPTCQFSCFRNGTKRSLASSQSITYQNMSVQGQPGYFYQTCTLTHPVQDLGLGSHAFRVKAYPNVTGSSSDKNYGVDSDLTPSVTIDYPRVMLQSCPRGYVLEGSTVSCGCRETANTFLSARTSFSQGSTVQSSGPGLTTYNFIANRSSIGLTCQATLFNWTSNAVTYKPQVAYGPKNVTVKVNNLTAPVDISLCDKSQPVTVNVTCTVSVDSVSPGADYEFIINGSRRPANPVGSSFLTYSVTTGGLLSVQCTGSNSVFKEVTATSTEQHLLVIEPPAVPPIIDKYQDSGSPVAGTDGHLTVQEGINTRIRCRAEGGYPSVSSVSLGCGRLTITNGENVAFVDVNVNRSRDARQCFCTATHSSPCYRNKKTGLSLDVLFGPTLVFFTVNETAETEIVVEKDSELRLACEAEGNPSPSLALTKDGLQLEVYNGPLQKFNLSLKLNKTKTDCRDAGVYSCRAQTGQVVANKSVDVNVRCPQQLENPLIQNKVYLTKTNSSINISVAVLGYPEPTLQLNSDLGLDMKAYNLTYIRQKPSYGVVSLQIYTVTTSVFQNYSLSINNSLGILVYSFQIQEGDPVISGSNPGKKDSNVGAIVGGVVGGVLAIVLVVGIVIFLKKRGVFDSKKSPDSTMQLHNEDETEEPTVVFDNKDLYSSGKEVVFDNKDLYATGREAEVVFDNKDLYYSNRKSDEVVTDNSSLYYMGRDAPGQNGQDSTYKSYSKVTTTMTSASAMPSNMTNQKPAAASAYEDVSIAEPSSKKNDKPKPATASKPKPTTKPKPGDPSKQAVNPADQIYATVVKVSKANKPFVVNKEESPPPQPEIPIKAFEKVDKDSINSKTKESVNHNGGNPDQDSSSFSYANNAFSELEDDVNVYANTNK